MDCNKVKYSTESFAMQDVARIGKVSKRDKVPVRAYLCNRCKGWHLTSSEDMSTYKYLIESYKSSIELLRDENEQLMAENKILKKGSDKEENIVVKTNNQIKTLNKVIGKQNEIIAKLRKTNKELASEIYHIKK